MRAETPVSTGSIPVSRMSVKRAMACLLEGLPVKSDEMTAEPLGEITSVELRACFDRLLSAERQAVVSARFQAGDLWNALHDTKFKSRRAQLLGAVRADMPDGLAEKYLHRLRHCGWVSRKVPLVKRVGNHGWTHWVKEASGQSDKHSASLPLPFYCAVRRLRRDEGEWYECSGSGEKRILIRIPSVLEEGEE